MKKPKVVQVTVASDEDKGGVFTAVERFAAALRPWCEHVAIDFSERDGPVTGDRVRLRTADHGLGRRFGWIPARESARGHAALAGADFVFIHVPFRHHAGWAARWCLRNGVPYAFVPHGAFDPYVFTYRVWRKRLWLLTEGRRMLRGAAFILYATLGEALKGERVTGARPRQILPWATPAPAVLDRTGAAARVRQRYGLGPDTKILLFLGRLHAMKRPRETVEDFIAVQPAGWHLLVAGPDETVRADDLRALGGSVTVCGPVFGEAKSELLAAADALVLFSHRENFGFVVTEALAHGAPVLVSDELDLAPDLAARGCGWVVPGGTAAGRRAALAALPGFAAADGPTMGARGREWVLAEMDERCFAARLREMVEAALVEKAAPGR